VTNELAAVRLLDLESGRARLGRSPS
jgi:hypothetical protein